MNSFPANQGATRLKPLFAIMVILVVVASAANVFVVSRGGELSRGTACLWYATYSYLVALAVEAHRKSRKLPAPFEYGAFVFFGWPVVVPYYLYTLRRWRGVALGIGFLLFSYIPDVASLATYLLIED